MSKRHLFTQIPVNMSSSELSDSGGAIKPKSMDNSCLLSTFLDLFLLCMSSFFCCFVFFAVRIPPWGVRRADRSCTPGPRLPVQIMFFALFATITASFLTKSLLFNRWKAPCEAGSLHPLLHLHLHLHLHWVHRHSWLHSLLHLHLHLHLHRVHWHPWHWRLAQEG